MRTPRTVAVVATALSLMLGSAGLATADTLPGETEDRTFAKSAGGWTSDSTYAGLCIPAVTCAVVNNTHQASGGVGGSEDGYLAVGFGSLLSAVEGTSTGIWRSPEFVYTGAGGAVPATVEFGMAVRPNVGGLLSVGNSSSYRVDLVAPSGHQVTVVPTTNLTAGTAWTALPKASVDPASLTIGQRYRIQISTSLVSTLGVLNTGEVGFDNVALSTTPRPPAGGTTAPGASPGSGTKANGGSTVVSAGQLAKISRGQITPRAVKVRKNTVTLTVRCPKSAKPLNCKINVRGLAKAKKWKVATSARTVTVKPGKTKKVTLKVKKAYVKKYKKAKTTRIRTTVKVGKVKTTVHKKVRVRR